MDRKRSRATEFKSAAGSQALSHRRENEELRNYSGLQGGKLLAIVAHDPCPSHVPTAGHTQPPGLVNTDVHRQREAQSIGGRILECRHPCDTRHFQPLSTKPVWDFWSLLLHFWGGEGNESLEGSI